MVVRGLLVIAYFIANDLYQGLMPRRPGYESSMRINEERILMGLSIGVFTQEQEMQYHRLFPLVGKISVYRRPLDISGPLDWF